MTTKPDYRSIWSELYDCTLSLKWVNAGGVRTRCMFVGDSFAPPLLMLPGTGGHLETFAPNLRAHSQHFYCIAIDSLGHGLSDKPAGPYEIATYVSHVKELLDTLKIQRVSILGVSLGAWVAAKFAATFQDRVDLLTLISAAGYYANPTNMASIRSVRGNAVAEPTWENVSAVVKSLVYEESTVTDDIVALRQAIYRQPGMVEAMEAILALQDLQTRRRNLLPDNEWASIVAPTLVVGATDHQDEYLETALRIRMLIPNASYVVMRNVGHWPHFENPEVFNALNLKFLLNATARGPSQVGVADPVV